MALSKLVKTKELYDCQTPYLQELFDGAEYPWEMLPRIKGHIAKLLLSSFLKIFIYHQSARNQKHTSEYHCKNFIYKLFLFCFLIHI